MTKMFIVSHGRFEREDVILFATKYKFRATRYVTKFNRILKEYKKFNERLEHTIGPFTHIKGEFVENYFDRWDKVRGTGNAFWQEIEVR